MKDHKNESGVDRMARIIIAEVLLLSGYLWLSDIWQIGAYVVGAVALITAVTGYCGAYKMVGINTYSENKKSVSGLAKSILVVIFLIIAAIGIYYGNF